MSLTPRLFHVELWRKSPAEPDVNLWSTHHGSLGYSAVGTRNPFWRVTGSVRYAVVASRGVWRSLVARFVRDEEAVGSNPATPTCPMSQGIGIGLNPRLGFGLFLWATVWGAAGLVVPGGVQG
jgi:hypothetical protein